HFNGDIEFIPQLKRQVVIATIANNFKAAADLKLQQHEAAFLIKMKFYISFTVTKILLLERLKELITDLISILMNSGFQPHKCYLKFPAMGHGTNFFPGFSVYQ